jgi:hypothetical protein
MASMEGIAVSNFTEKFICIDSSTTHYRTCRCSTFNVSGSLFEETVFEEGLLQIENLSVESQPNRLCYAARGHISKLFF